MRVGEGRGRIATRGPRPSLFSPPIAGDAGGNTLTSAADAVDRIGRARFAQWYAGTSVDRRAGTLTVHRKPGSSLDRAVRADVSGVKLRFSGAELSEQQMAALVDRIVTDTDYWRQQGIAVKGAGPLPDGSGVSVLTTAGTDEEAARLSRHYNARVVVQPGRPTAGPGPRFSPTYPWG